LKRFRELTSLEFVKHSYGHFCFAGNIAFTAGGIAILMSGGLAAPIVIGIGVSSALTGVGSR
jgi:hypothetical protein